jgi:hypothetical protein
MCNLYSITTNQAPIIALFRVMNQYVGNLPPIVCTENLIRIYQVTESAKLAR